MIPVLKSLDKAANQAQDVASDTRTAVDRMYRMGEETRDELQKGVEVANEDIQRAMECLKAEVSKLMESAAMVTNDSNGLGDQQENGWLECVTYADSLNRWLQVAHLSTLARSQVKERQVLIDKDLASKLNQLAELNKRKLVAKANEALT